MTGWNLPPGCEVSDLPGNGPIFCDGCGISLQKGDDDGTECPLCDDGNLFCRDCYRDHEEKHEEAEDV